jgi:hypothetical protein
VREINKIKLFFITFKFRDVNRLKVSFTSDVSVNGPGFILAWRCSDETTSMQDLHEQNQKKWFLSWTIADVWNDDDNINMMLFNFYDENNSMIAQDRWTQAVLQIGYIDYGAHTNKLATI